MSPDVEIVTSPDAPGYIAPDSGNTHGVGPWNNPQMAFFIPLKHIDETWAWAKKNRGYGSCCRRVV